MKRCDNTSNATKATIVVVGSSLTGSLGIVGICEYIPAWWSGIINTGLANTTEPLALFKSVLHAAVLVLWFMFWNSEVGE